MGYIIPPERMKGGVAHTVPLTPEILALLEAFHASLAAISFSQQPALKGP